MRQSAEESSNHGTSNTEKIEYTNPAPHCPNKLEVSNFEPFASINNFFYYQDALSNGFIVFFYPPPELSC